jgi:predicted GNAT family N-acyltransferase
MAEHKFIVTESRVAIEKDGRDVSGLHLGRREFQVGRGAYVSMGTIGGVSTPRQFRGQGLSSAVMARTVEEMRARGLATTGLYTGTRIVAHRLYRRFGYVDIFIPHLRTLILNMPAFLKRQARSWLRRAEGTPAGARAAARLRGTVVFDLGADGCYSLRLDGGDVSLRTGRSRAAQLTLSLSQSALVSLFARTVSSAELLRQGELQVSGSKALWRRLQGTVFPRWETPIEEE